jgi:2-polyprenyl-3-methyl-5-hydroxy-6-metoxy-1,4-benzoquinol methylase
MKAQSGNVDYFNAEAAAAADEKISFSFGANWKKFLAGFNEETLRRAEKSFVEFTHLPRLVEHEFLDVGCGSGLSSLVALRLGAQRVVSVDIDPHSVECARALREKFEIPQSRWEIEQGSALDPAFMESLGRFSYVHSWGVLHHTGAMWSAIENVVRYNTTAGGHLHLALYNKHRTSQRWLTIKRWCNGSPRVVFPLVKWAYISALFAKMSLRLTSPVSYVRQYNAERGMNFFRDIDDWIGGLPYEFTSPGETMDFLSDRGFSLVRLKTTDSCGCNEFLFRRE